MPIIVPIEENHEGIAGLTDARFRAPDYSGSGLDALGAGLAQVGDGGQQLASGLEERRRKAAVAIAAAMLDDKHQGNIDDAAVKNAYVDYSDGAAKQLYGEDGLFNKQGAEAHAAFPHVVLALADAHDKATAQLDKVQRDVVVPALQDKLRTDVERAADHVRQQGVAEQKWQSTKLQQATWRDAVNHADDPDLFDHHLATGENAIRQQAKIDNVSDKVLAKQIADYKSGVHADTIDALTWRDPVHAAGWYARHGDNLNGRDKIRVETELGAARAGAGTGEDGAAYLVDAKSALVTPHESDDHVVPSVGRLEAGRALPARFTAMWRGGPSTPMLALLDQADANSPQQQSKASVPQLLRAAIPSQSGNVIGAEPAASSQSGPDVVVQARRQVTRPRTPPHVATVKPKPPSPPPPSVKPDRGAERAAQWAYEMNGSTEYQEYGFDSRVGGTKGWIAGYSAPKCNFFVHDALEQGGIPQTTVNGQRRIALAGDWGNRNSVIPGFRPLTVDENGNRLEPVRKGDIVSNGGHVGMVVGIPYKGRAKYVVASAADPDHGDTVTLTEFGFRPEDNPRKEKFKIVIWRHVSH